MTGSEKYTWGVILAIGGSVAATGGIALTATLIGACLGIPLAIIGLPAMIWGIVWTYQGHFQKQQEVISAGIREGITSAQAANIFPPPFPSAAGAMRSASIEATPTAPDHLVKIPEESVSSAIVAHGDERTALDVPLNLEVTEGGQQPGEPLDGYRADDSTPTAGSILPS